MNLTTEQLELLELLHSEIPHIAELDHRRDEIVKKCGPLITDPDILQALQRYDEVLAQLRERIAALQALLPAPTN